MKSANEQPSLPFSLTGKVQRGKTLGSQLGFPTANMAYLPGRKSFPPDGVYAAVAILRGERYLAVLNQGYHPTSPEGMPTVEAHLIGLPWQPLYDEELQLEYRCFLRREQTFQSLDALQAQLASDRKNAIEWAQKHCPELLKSSDQSPHI